MRVEFEKLHWYEFAKDYLIDLGLDQAKTQELLNYIKTGAAMIASGRVNSPDQELVRAVKALRKDFENSREGLFEAAVGALTMAVSGMTDAELRSARVDTIVKRAAIEAGHGLEVKGVSCDSESELIADDQEDDDRSILDAAIEPVWDLIADETHTHGEVVCLTNQSIVSLRDRLAAEVGLARSSASRLITSAVTASRVLARMEQTEEGAETAAARVLELEETLSISKCSLETGALADRALGRLEMDDTRFADLSDFQMAVLAVTAPFAQSVRDVLDLLTMGEAQQLQVIKVLGNAARAWLSNVSKGKEKARPSLRAALDVVGVALPVPVVVVPVAVPVAPLATEAQMSLALEVEEAVAEVVVPAAVPAVEKKPCAVRAARRTRARGRRRCLMTLDLFGNPAAAPGEGGQEGAGFVDARRVIESVRVPRVVCGGEVGAEEGVLV